MKIDEACINHNVALVVDEITKMFYDILNDNSQDNLYRVECLGEVRGALLLAEKLKEVLKQ